MTSYSVRRAGARNGARLSEQAIAEAKARTAAGTPLDGRRGVTPVVCLREAASLMRHHARTEATLRDGDPYYTPARLPDGSLLTEMGQYELHWHPVVALAVADWLDAAYAKWEYAESSLGQMSIRAMSGGTNDPDPAALAVARAYLGADPP